MPTPRRACSTALGVGRTAWSSRTSHATPTRMRSSPSRLVVAEAGRDLAAGHLGLPHAALHGAVPQGRFRGRALAGRLPHLGPGRRRPVARQPGRFAAEHHDGDPRMDRASRLLAFRAGSISRFPAPAADPDPARPAAPPRRTGAAPARRAAGASSARRPAGSTNQPR